MCTSIVYSMEWAAISIRQAATPPRFAPSCGRHSHNLLVFLLLFLSETGIRFSVVPGPGPLAASDTIGQDRNSHRLTVLSPGGGVGDSSKVCFALIFRRAVHSGVRFTHSLVAWYNNSPSQNESVMPQLIPGPRHW